MMGEMTVKKVMVMKNDRFRNQERLVHKFGPLVVLTKGAKGVH